MRSTADREFPWSACLSCSLVDSEIEISITPGTLLAQIHPGESRRIERTHCNYGLVP